MADYSKEVKKIEQIITTAKELNKAFAGGPDDSYKNGLSAMEFIIAVCEPLIADIKGRKTQAEQSNHSVFNLEQERKRLKVEGKVL